MPNTYQSPLHSLATNHTTYTIRTIAKDHLWLTWTLLHATNCHEYVCHLWVGYQHEKNTFTFNNIITTPIDQTWPQLPSAKDPGTPIERAISDASQIATHLVDDAIATPKLGGTKGSNKNTRPMVWCVFQGMLLKITGMIQIAAIAAYYEAA